METLVVTECCSICSLLKNCENKFGYCPLPSGEMFPAGRPVPKFALNGIMSACELKLRTLLQVKWCDAVASIQEQDKDSWSTASLYCTKGHGAVVWGLPEGHSPVLFLKGNCNMQDCRELICVPCCKLWKFAAVSLIASWETGETLSVPCKGVRLCQKHGPFVWKRHSEAKLDVLLVVSSAYLGTPPLFPPSVASFGMNLNWGRLEVEGGSLLDMS